MTTKQHENLRLAEVLETHFPGSAAHRAAAELRRLHAANLDCMAWYEAIRSDYDKLKAEHEALLAACGVVAMADTPDSAKKARIMHPDYESASCDDVKRRVDECIALRARVAELEDVLTNLPLSSPQRMRARIQRLEEMLAAVGAGGVGPLMPVTAQPPVVKLPQGDQGPVAWMYDLEIDGEVIRDWLTSDYDEAHSPTMAHYNIRPFYTHPQNLRCKSTQARLATLWGYEKPQRNSRTDREIIEQTEELAGLLMRAFHQREKADPLSTFQGSRDIRASHCWSIACQIQELLTDTDPMNATSELDAEAAHGIGSTM